jgi:hypothetical protein
MKNLPSDRAILKRIYQMYEVEYPGSPEDGTRGENDPYLSIDIPSVAKKIGCSPEMLFGRLYYHLDQKHRYKQDDGSVVPLFYMKLGDKRHAVHFPYLAAILATHEQEHRKHLWSISLSVLALVLSVASLAVNFYRR